MAGRLGGLWQDGIEGIAAVQCFEGTYSANGDFKPLSKEHYSNGFYWDPDAETPAVTFYHTNGKVKRQCFYKNGERRPRKNGEANEITYWETGEKKEENWFVGDSNAIKTYREPQDGPARIFYTERGVPWRKEWSRLGPYGKNDVEEDLGAAAYDMDAGEELLAKDKTAKTAVALLTPTLKKGTACSIRHQSTEKGQIQR